MENFTTVIRCRAASAFFTLSIWLYRKTYRYPALSQSGVNLRRLGRLSLDIGTALLPPDSRKRTQETLDRVAKGVRKKMRAVGWDYLTS